MPEKLWRRDTRSGLIGNKVGRRYLGVNGWRGREELSIPIVGSPVLIIVCIVGVVAIAIGWHLVVVVVWGQGWRRKTAWWTVNTATVSVIPVKKVPEDGEELLLGQITQLVNQVLE